MTTPTSRIRAVGLLSGGLDSALAARLVLDQDVEAHAHLRKEDAELRCSAAHQGSSSAIAGQSGARFSRNAARRT